MSNDSLLGTIERQISEMEGKLQKAMKHSKGEIISDDMKDWLKYLHEKRREIINRRNQK